MEVAIIVVIVAVRRLAFLLSLIPALAIVFVTGLVRWQPKLDMCIENKQT